MARPFFYFGKRGVSVLGNHVGGYIEYAPKNGIANASPFWTKVVGILFLCFVGLMVYVDKFA